MVLEEGRWGGGGGGVVWEVHEIVQGFGNFNRLKSL